MKGQELAKQLLQARLSNPPSFLFSGERGIGKSTTAKVFANSLLGSNIKTHPDRYEVLESLRIEEVRNIISWTNQSPSISSSKVAIIHDCESASSAAFQALLKVIEESNNTTFILTTSDISLLPPTIASRLINVPFLPLSREETAEIVDDLASLNLPPTFPNSPGLILTLKVALAKLKPHISLLPPQNLTQAFNTARAIHLNLHDIIIHHTFALYLAHLWYQLGYFEQAEIANKTITKINDRNSLLVWEDIMWRSL
ncbi:MAG: AAA family ATPase [Cyanobacteria bacterium J06639_18]